MGQHGQELILVAVSFLQRLLRARTLGHLVLQSTVGLLQLGARSLTRYTLQERRELLEETLGQPSPALRLSSLLEGTVDQIVAAVREHGLEGVVAKRGNPIYEPGKRSGAWAKLPLNL